DGVAIPTWFKRPIMLASPSQCCICERGISAERAPDATRLEAEAERRAHVAPGERHIVLGEAGVAARIDIEDVVRRKAQRRRAIGAKRTPRNGCVHKRVAGGRRLERRDTRLL